MFSSFFNEPRNRYGLQTISIENSVAPIPEYLVIPTELMDLFMALGGKITTKRVDEGWIAAIISYKDMLRTVSYPPITFRTFVGRDEDDLKDEAIDWFKINKLDICNVDNWILKK